MSEIQKKDIEIDYLKMQLENRQFTLNKKKADNDGQIMNLKSTISNLKEKIKSRAEYLHPMVFQDLKEQLARTYDKIDKILFENSEMRNNYESIGRQLKNKREEARYGAVELNNIKKNMDSSSK